MSLVLVVSRLAVVGLSLVGMVQGLPTARHPHLYVAGTVLILGFSLVLVAQSLQARRLPTPAWGAADAVVAGVACVLCAVLVPASYLEELNGWVGWGAGLAGNSITLIGAWGRRLRHLALVPALLVTYVVSAVAINHAPWTFVLPNVGLWCSFALAALTLSRTWLGLEAEADRQRTIATREAEQRVLDRARLVVHDPAAILRMLADPSTPAASLPALRAQASMEARRLRSFMSDDPTPAPEATDLSVASAVRAALAGFDDLPIEVALDLAADAYVTEPVHLALQTAVTTCLHNVREHAQATAVFVHADAMDGRWEIVIRDDGVGFDPTGGPLGHGLRTLVIGNLTHHGVEVQLDASPSDGCTLTFSGPVA